MRQPTVATIQLLTVAVVVAVILLFGVSASDYALCLAVLRLLDTWLRHTGRARAARGRRDEQRTI
jgi:hypothetical protein